MPDLNTQLRHYLEHVVEHVDIAELAEQRTGAEPVRPIQPRVPPRPARRGLISTVAAAAAVLLVAGVAAALVSVVPVADPAGAPGSTVESTTTLAPATTAAADFDQERLIIGPAPDAPFVAESVVGEWTWTPIDEWADPPPVVDAYLDRYYAADYAAGPSLVSEDGLFWSPLTGPASSYKLAAGGDTLVAYTDFVTADAAGGIGPGSEGREADVAARDGVRMWRYEDGEWVEFEPPVHAIGTIDRVLILPAIDVEVVGSVVVVRPGTARVYPDVFGHESPLVRYYGLDWGQPVHDVSTGTIQVHGLDEGTGLGPLVGSLTVETDEGPPPVIRFRDRESGELVHEIGADVEGLTADQVWELMYTSEVGELDPSLAGFPDAWLFVSKDGGPFNPAVLPRPVSFEDPQFAGLDDGLLALVDDQLWTSTDGVAWTRIEPGGVDLAGGDLAGGGDRVFLTAEAVWTSTNGRDWQPTDLPSLQSVHRAAFGWVAVTWPDGWTDTPAKVFISTDAVTWDEVQSPPDTCDGRFVEGTLFTVSCPIPFDAFTRWTATLGTG